MHLSEAESRLPVPPPAFAAQSLEYPTLQYGGRPGLITAIGVMSIVVAALSIIWSLGSVAQAGFFYMMSMISSSAAGAAAPGGSPPGSGSVLIHSTTVHVGRTPVLPRAMEAAERESTVAALARLQPLLPSRKRQLEAILASAGREMGTDQVTSSGTMPEMRSGEPPPDFFTTPSGRLELYNDRAVFFPTGGGPAVRVSAPTAGADVGTKSAPPGAAGEETTTADEDAGAAATGPASNSTTAPSTAPGALSAAEIQSIIQQAQSRSGNGLNAAQVNSLQMVLSVPGQQLVQPGAAAGSVDSAVAAAGTAAYVHFSDGGSLSLGAQGDVLSMVAAPVMPTFSFRPMTLGLMIASAMASLGLAVYLLVCGIMTLRQSPRGRRLHFIYVGIKLPLAVVAGVASAWATHDLMASVGGSAAPTVFPAVASGALPLILGIAYPIALLIALNLKATRDYYRV